MSGNDVSVTETAQSDQVCNLHNSGIFYLYINIIPPPQKKDCFPKQIATIPPHIIYTKNIACI